MSAIFAAKRQILFKSTSHTGCVSYFIFVNYLSQHYPMCSGSRSEEKITATVFILQSFTESNRMVSTISLISGAVPCKFTIN